VNLEIGIESAIEAGNATTDMIAMVMESAIACHVKIAISAIEIVICGRIVRLSGIGFETETGSVKTVIVENAIEGIVGETEKETKISHIEIETVSGSLTDQDRGRDRELRQRIQNRLQCRILVSSKADGRHQEFGP